MAMASQSAIWRHSDGAVPNLLAFSYIAVAHLGGIALMATPHALAWAAGVLLVAHSLVIAAYMIHDVAHMSIFRTRQQNLRAGEVFSWLCGSAYAPIERIWRLHMRHHGDIADLALFDPRVFLQSAPGWFRRAVYALEWCYVPAIELIMHYQIVARPFLNADFAADRRRVILMGLSRLVFFAGLFALSPWALAGYGVAYMMFLTALFVADAYAHTYEFYLIRSADEKIARNGRDEVYDREHTFSNLISVRWPLLNLLNLNFGYHSVHHDLPSVPWHRLPALHNKTFASGTPQVLPYRELWRSFHANRLKRIEAADAGTVGTGPHRADDFLGVHGVSFLTVV
jgi:fatty acid desaturase